MIGVLSDPSERATVKEFFELFKTPWEFWREEIKYEVIICTQTRVPITNAKQILLYNADITDWDEHNNLSITKKNGQKILFWNKFEFPIYEEISEIEDIKNISDPMGKARNPFIYKITLPSGIKVIRIGYSLFGEINSILTNGQPKRFAHIPTIDLHIQMLKNYITDAGITLIEIPPMPHGYEFICCLTHDVDFIKLRDHKFDHTMLGFIYRSFLGSFLNFIKRKISWKKILQNWISLLKLPGVYIGIVRDYFDQFERYIEIEEKMPSTFFIIPFKNYAGLTHNGSADKKRACRYDIMDIKATISLLTSNGREIGLHGIDAWIDSEKGHSEYEQILKIVKKPTIGTRMHWLYLNEQSPRALEQAGFYYDSTFGYNDSIGYRAGTSQVYRPPGADELLEIPLNIQDTAMFYPNRMDLSEDQAMEVCCILFHNASRYGGVLTINWHHRSLAPERLWEDFYIRLLNNLKEYRVWFETCEKVVRWFQQRRNLTFEMIRFTDAGLKIKIRGQKSVFEPGFCLRIHKPGAENTKKSDLTMVTTKFKDIPFEINAETAVVL